MFRTAFLAAALLCAAAVSARADVRSMVDHAAAVAGVPNSVAHAIIRHESGYRPYVRGRAGEWGLGQILCQTARGVGFRGSCSRLADPQENLRWSMTYLALALKGSGDLCARVSRYQTGIHRRPGCTAYGRKVLAARHP